MAEITFKVGDLVTRDGTDVHRVIEADDGSGLILVECIKEPMVMDAPNTQSPSPPNTNKVQCALKPGWLAEDMKRATERVASGFGTAPPVARPLAEWHEDMGPVLWWKFPINEEPWVGTPNDIGFPVQASVTLATHFKQLKRTVRMNVGGWPGYHTHWTPISVPATPSS